MVSKGFTADHFEKGGQRDGMGVFKPMRSKHGD